MWDAGLKHNLVVQANRETSAATSEVLVALYVSALRSSSDLISSLASSMPSRTESSSKNA